MHWPRGVPTPAMALVAPACRRGLGLGGGGGSSGSGRAVAAFAFGPPEGWQRFSVYFLTADGDLWSLCPVVPFGACAVVSSVCCQWYPSVRVQTRP